ncbi:hypothetical protein [Helicobacter sp. 23-1045]
MIKNASLFFWILPTPLIPLRKGGGENTKTTAREGEVEKAPPLAGGVWGGVFVARENLGFRFCDSRENSHNFRRILQFI